MGRRFLVKSLETVELLLNNVHTLQWIERGFGNLAGSHGSYYAFGVHLSDWGYTYGKSELSLSWPRTVRFRDRASNEAQKSLCRSTVWFLLAADERLACYSLIHFSSLSLCRIGKHAIMCYKGKLSIASTKMCFVLHWQLLFHTSVSPFLISFSTSRILLVTWLGWMREIS